MNSVPPAAKATVEMVTSMHRWTDSLFSFKTTKPADYSFVAGQYARLGLEHEGAMIWRPYSMVSAPQEKELEFYSILVPGGSFTTLLNRIEPGMPIHLEKQPYGFMTADRFTDGTELWMLSTGTGIGPFISILRDPFVWTRYGRIILVHCVRHAGELAYGEELMRIAARAPQGNHARFQLIQCVTREAAAPAGVLNGRITSLVQNGLLEQAAGLPLTVDDSRVMLCGNPQMIDEMREILKARGMRPARRAVPGQYVTENYW
ncbi:ferredoxin--NADP+ reductase [Noviherbaspirillum humi]|uniref:ferredoxin--NADP(+) reductase n=1 Tax=Noviherbaspirillum humi TaxID=1688639 RepID=A0A239G2Q8_9BURK|nr:ferredoxin--NADP reductase [Noviherbaspirillum humi]SNS63449.1 ferredoxin--NADP+ reductase [Noviherbaspirillum humi]